ncbi:hypothetical protein [Bradyrhizobium sp. McL0616]|uniref:hypothetical protein n=1 Tax=Bradyrhizobium sp. McL0616 TaxID=3415674 RepID=UPI003CEA70B5
MTEQPLVPATPALPATPAEAATRLGELKADPKWTASLLSGGPAQVREFQDLHEIAAKGSDVAAAMAGGSPTMASSDLREMIGTAEMLKDVGFTPLSIRETLEGRPASQAEVDMATKWKADHLSDAEWVKRLMSGDVEAKRHLLVANVILSSPVKQEQA